MLFLQICKRGVLFLRVYELFRLEMEMKKGGCEPPLNLMNVFSPQIVEIYSFDKSSVPVIAVISENAKSFLPRSLSDAPM